MAAFVKANKDEMSVWRLSCCVSCVVCVVCAVCGTGLAGALLTQILAKAREVGLPEVWLWPKDQTAAMYEKYGWVRKESAVYHGDQISIMQALLPPRSDVV